MYAPMTAVARSGWAVVSKCWLLTWTVWTAKSSRMTPRMSSHSVPSIRAVSAQDAVSSASAHPVLACA
ncbi:Uncharacterised protein [Mycobacteroides abscessus subsp. abscessus]|nr:Uncharacterised protein [Mycobacteroides abscessus subsp. abscessus]